MKKLYLIRHPKVNVPSGVCYGGSDIPLLDKPDETVQRLRPLLPENYIVFSSPLRRCRELAEALGPVRTDERLTEMNFGDWEMQAYDQIDRSLIDAWAVDPLLFRPPGGECVAEMKARALAALDEMLMADEHRNLVIVSHGGPLRAICGHLLDLEPAKWLSLEFTYGGLSRLAITPEGVILRGVNL